MVNTQLVIIGGGPAGMAAAVSAYESGIRDMLILERDEGLGGVLRQCIHNGFGLHRFKEELTGPEYSYRLEQQINELKIPYYVNTMVTDITKDKVITAMSEEKGIVKIKAQAIIIASGCRERPSGALRIPGSRPAGVFTAGTAQRYVNMRGMLPGKEVVILGSGDIGLIMARRMTLEGAKVKAVCELMPYSGGLTRNIVQCLDDFGIPLKLSHTVIELHGKKRLKGVTIAKVGEDRKPIAGTEEYIPCDTLLLSVGLIPENELAKKAGIEMDPITGGAVTNEGCETSVEGIYACGNALHVHDLADYASEEAEKAGKAASEYILKKSDREKTEISVVPCGHVRYTVPQRISEKNTVKIYFRGDNICNCAIIEVKDGDNVLMSKKKERLAPGEMEYIILKEDVIGNVKSGKISVEVRENG